MELPLPALTALAVLVFLAGIVDALAGGGGLITLPAYLAVGLPPSLLLGTNKLASTIGTVMSAARYTRSARFSFRRFWPAIAAALIGSYLGARLALLLDPRFLRWILVFILPPVAYAVSSHHDFGRVDRSAELPARELAARESAVTLPIAAYDGFFGPGTGTFFALALSRFCGFDLLQATTRAKVLNLSSNAAALAAFLWAGKAHVGLGLTMGAVSVAGHYVGAHLGINRGARAIRPMMAAVCLGLLLKIALDLVQGR